GGGFEVEAVEAVGGPAAAVLDQHPGQTVRRRAGQGVAAGAGGVRAEEALRAGQGGGFTPSAGTRTPARSSLAARSTPRSPAVWTSPSSSRATDASSSSGKSSQPTRVVSRLPSSRASSDPRSRSG